MITPHPGIGTDAATRTPALAAFRENLATECWAAETLCEAAQTYGLAVAQRMSGDRTHTFLCDPDPAASGHAWIMLETDGDGATRECPLPAPARPASDNADSRIPPWWWRAAFVKYNAPAYFAVLGPEGVGKTTTCGLVVDAFARLPVRFRHFHHVHEWKPPARPDAAARRAPGALSQAPQGRTLPESVRRLRRALVPAALAGWIRPLLAEVEYMDRVSGLLTQTSRARQIVLSDRYCYDRNVLWTHMKKSSGQRFASDLQCRIMRRPKLAFLLQDDPALIHARKPTLTTENIARHQHLLVETCERFRVPYEIVRLDGRPPNAVAAHLVQRMISTVNDDLFDLLDDRR